MAFTHLLRSSKIFRNISACDIFYQPPPVYQEIIPEIFAKLFKQKKIPFFLWNVEYKMQNIKRAPCHISLGKLGLNKVKQVTLLKNFLNFQYVKVQCESPRGGHKIQNSPTSHSTTQGASLRVRKMYLYETRKSLPSVLLRQPMWSQFKFVAHQNSYCKNCIRLEEFSILLG